MPNIPFINHFLVAVTTTVPGLLIIMLMMCAAQWRYPILAKWLFLPPLIMLALSSPPVKELVVSELESRHLPLAEPPHDTTHILVLAAGHSSDESLAPISQLNASSLVRLVEGARLWRLLPTSALIVSGDAGFNAEDSAQSEVAARAAVWLGVEETRIVTQDNVSDTEQEVTQAAQIVGSGHLVIVTSAVHLPRALEIAAAAGIRTTGAPTNFTGGSTTQPWWRFGASYLLHVDRALHEYAGLLEVRLTAFLGQDGH